MPEAQQGRLAAPRMRLAARSATGGEAGRLCGCVRLPRERRGSARRAFDAWRWRARVRGPVVPHRGTKLTLLGRQAAGRDNGEDECLCLQLDRGGTDSTLFEDTQRRDGSQPLELLVRELDLIDLHPGNHLQDVCTVSDIAATQPPSSQRRTSASCSSKWPMNSPSASATPSIHSNRRGSVRTSSRSAFTAATRSS